MTVHLVSRIDVKDFGAGVLRVGDLNGDGAPDLLLVQSVYETREITCLTAVTISGEIIWQTGKPDRTNARGPYADLPVQVHDWDNDGANEVMYVKQATYVGAGRGVRERAPRYEGNAAMVVLDARTGKEKKRFAIPAPADDSFAFADLTGRGRRQDLVVKDRYWNMWGVSFAGAVLWHWKGSTGHYPAVADVDGDGKDEVFVGYTLIDHDGGVLWDHHPAGGRSEPHSDANWIARLPDGSWRLLFGNHGAHCLTPDGAEAWRHELDEGYRTGGTFHSEAQHVVVGRFRPESPMQAAVIGRGSPRSRKGKAGLYLFDVATGREIWRRKLPAGSWAVACRELDWSGAGRPGKLLVYGMPTLREFAAIYNGDGEVVDVLPIPWKAPPATASGKEVAYATRADVWGDGRQEAIFFGPRGICIYANARPPARPAHCNETVYSGM